MRDTSSIRATGNEKPRAKKSRQGRSSTHSAPVQTQFLPQFNQTQCHNLSTPPTSETVNDPITNLPNKKSIRFLFFHLLNVGLAVGRGLLAPIVVAFLEFQDGVLKFFVPYLTADFVIVFFYH